VIWIRRRIHPDRPESRGSRSLWSELAAYSDAAKRWSSATRGFVVCRILRAFLAPTIGKCVWCATSPLDLVSNVS
jgi:hypothetical protein